jgi:Fe2+ transport system protein FeoA
MPVQIHELEATGMTGAARATRTAGSAAGKEGAASAPPAAGTDTLAPFRAQREGEPGAGDSNASAMPPDGGKAARATSRLARLSAFGLVPGSDVELLQRRPAAVLRVGETELALGDDVLERIWVKVDAG